jgi:hypothetical protein
MASRKPSSVVKAGRKLRKSPRFVLGFNSHQANHPAHKVLAYVKTERTQEGVIVTRYGAEEAPNEVITLDFNGIVEYLLEKGEDLVSVVFDDGVPTFTELLGFRPKTNLDIPRAYAYTPEWPCYGGSNQ